jgi:hypothetical protein
VIRLTFWKVLSKCGVCCYFRWISKQCVHLIFISEVSGISNKGVNVVGRCTGRLLQSCLAQKTKKNVSPSTLERLLNCKLSERRLYCHNVKSTKVED